MKENNSTFDQYLNGFLEESDLEGIRFLDSNKEKKRSLLNEFDQHLGSHFKMESEDNEVLNSFRIVHQESSNAKFQRIGIKFQSNINARSIAAAGLLLFGVISVLHSLIELKTNYESIKISRLVIKSDNSQLLLNENDLNEALIINKSSHIKDNRWASPSKRGKEIINPENDCEFIDSINSLNKKHTTNNGTPTKTGPLINRSHQKKKEDLAENTKSKVVDTIKNNRLFTKEHLYDKKLNHAKDFITSVYLTRDYKNLKDPEFFLSEAELCKRIKNYKRAEQCYSKVLKIDSTNPKYFRYRAAFYQSIGEYGKAEMDYTKAIKLSPENLRFLRLRAELYKCSGEYGKAEMDYTKAIKLSPENLRFLGLRAELYKCIGEYGKAEMDYTKAIKLSPESLRFLRLRTELYKCIGGYAREVDDYSKQRQLKPRILKLDINIVTQEEEYEELDD